MIELFRLSENQRLTGKFLRRRKDAKPYLVGLRVKPHVVMVRIKP